MIEWVSFALVGVVAGVIAGLLGLGGGLIIVPALLLVFSIQDLPVSQLMHTAVGTSLMTITLTSLSSIYAHHKLGNINWLVVKRLVVGLVVGGLVGAYFATMLTSQFLQRCFAIYAFVVAIRMWLPMPPALDQRLLNKIVLFFFGNLVGSFSALVGIGGGTLVVPYLVIAKQSIYRAIGTSAVCGFPISVAAVLGFILFSTDKAAVVDQWQTGFIHWQAFLGIVSTSMIFAKVGAGWASRLPVKQLRQLFSMMLIIVAITMF